ncbi:uncharacterized protein AB9X84_013847 isoform 1-T1 [Acanthopagrus schlegelii]
MTELLGAAGEGDQMEEDTTQQDADSESGESPKCCFCFNSTVDQAGEIRLQMAANPAVEKALRVKVHSFTTGRTCGADGEIREQMENVKWHTNEEITCCQECDVIIVFCPIRSRVGSDVPAAMRKIPAGDKCVILVLMHHTRDVDFSTDVKKWSETYQNVKLDVHVLFHETQPGLLKCPRNDEAVQQIQTVLKDLSKSGF